MSRKLRVTCPVCGREVVAEGGKVRPPFPFCSERCRLVDLRRWLGEQYRLPGPGPEEAADVWEDEEGADRSERSRGDAGR